MQVYIELALLENFCMDFVLLYCAKLVAKNPAHIFRTVIASALGACFAVVFPLFNAGAVWGIVLKIFSGLIICLISGKFTGFKAYFKVTSVFLAFTFVLGGALIALFQLAGWDYSAGEGFYLSSVPIGIPLLCGLLLIILARKLAARLKKTERATIKIKICRGESFAELDGFYDSGNKVYSFSRPVSVIPLWVAQKLIDESRIKETVKIHTVAGSKKIKIFTADKVEIHDGENARIIKNVLFGISPYAANGAVLHPDLKE